MEIKFNKLCYVINKKSSSEKRYFDDVSLDIEEGTIVAFIHEDLSILGHMLMGIKRPTKGEIVIDGMPIKRTSHIKNINALRKKIGFVYDDKIKYNCSTVKDEIKEHMKNYGYKTKNVTKHIVDSLKIVGLDDKYLMRDPATLSLTEQKKLQLASVMSYNPEVIILENFSRGFTNRERDYFRKLFLKLKNKYNKTIILIGTDLPFLFDIVDSVHIISNGKLVLSDDKEIFYNKKLYKYVEMPPIVQFTIYANSEGHNINEYTDLKELIKELYRNVK